MRTPHFAQVPLLVAGSDLTAAAEWIVAEQFAQWLPLHLFEPPVTVPQGTVGMVWHERTDGDAPRAWLRDLISEVASPLAGARRPWSIRPKASGKTRARS